MDILDEEMTEEIIELAMIEIPKHNQIFDRVCEGVISCLLTKKKIDISYDDLLKISQIVKQKILERTENNGGKNC